VNMETILGRESGKCQNSQAKYIFAIWKMAQNFTFQNTNSQNLEERSLKNFKFSEKITLVLLCVNMRRIPGIDSEKFEFKRDFLYFGISQGNSPLRIEIVSGSTISRRFPLG